MDFVQKGAWWVAKNNGRVPLLEKQNGTLVYESSVIMDLAEDIGKDQGLQLYSKDPWKKAQQRLLIQEADNIMPQFHPIYRAKKPESIEK
mmetsp:Transcript_8270/g.6166  ORF Transcript_8270/g.6166 Transcript_8270/m.6166 type:complete len:90 (-) Transcript_8270:387-656(-)|eukprot:CAMPEP_0202977460 /NCGR_PEP_ID=MMETSP1396-20130829/84259_1 /ASSEMBLY_ACC=CAM_ASM_000872 /TAXON_ID= /ORGANISM="Pseudokeronopsis sp., Strain Brazil" /LENGTH=89 /DNA_ID=CAMNT_0049716205 /DNA_START=174 /DNA_END=443 /DNA_ORIENTATION=+